MVAVLFPLTGCVMNFGYHGSRGVSLSQAMKTSANGGGEVPPRHGSNGPHWFGNHDSDMGVPVSGGGTIALVSYDNREYAWQVPVSVAYAVPLNGEIQSLTRFTITPVAAETDHNFAGLFVAGDIVKLRPGSLPDRAANNAWMLESGVSYRYYITPAHTFLSPYLSANAAYQLLNWDYRNPIIVNGDTITSDSLDAIGAYVGLGLDIKRNSYLSVFGEAGFGGTVFMGNTYQGFHNDVFSDFGYFTVKAGLSLKF